MSSISGSVVNTTFTYDANGNQTGGNGLTLTYASFNKPATIARGSALIAFAHDSEHQRFKQMNPTGETLYLAGSGVMAERLLGAGGVVQWTNYFSAGGEMVAMRVDRSDATTYTRYFHKDHLGSIATITDAAGAVVERLSYDAWGKRRFPNGQDDPSGSIASQTTRGFTGHEQLADVGLVHMNGRVYDPMLGRFGTPDPMTEDPYNSQGWNRYTYVGNSPLNATDPSGYCWKGCFWQKPFKALGKLLRKFPIIGQIIQVAASAICIASVVCAPLAPAIAGLASAITTGLASGDLGMALKAGFIATATAFAMQGVGDITGHTPGFGSPEHFANIAGHAAVGCGSAVASGGKCGPGALSGAVGSFATPLTEGLSSGARLVAVSTVGGLASVAGGGKFGNGAVTAAFGYLFNQMARGFREDLREHESHGGHAIELHVGKSPEFLLDRTTEGGYWSQAFDIIPRRAGSFPSLEAANSLVNSTLSQNSGVIDKILSGDIESAFVTGTFGSKTGIEAYRNSPSSSPYIRDTYGVGVVVQRSSAMPSGFRILTAYPRND